MADLLCVERSIMPAVANVQNDQRRLSILLRNELLYAPTPSYLERVQSSLVIDESKRKELLIQVYDALCQDARQRNDVYQLAVNLFDRYLSRQALVSEKELQALTAACAMVSLKIRRTRRECLSYYQLLYHFHGVSEKSIMVKEKELFSLLKGNLNAVTPNDVTEELYRRMIDLIPSHLNFKLLDEANFLTNFCLLSYQFISVHPSVLASACLYDVILHNVSPSDRIVVLERLAKLTGVEKDVLLQQQINVNTAFQVIHKSCEDPDYTSTPTDIEEITEQEFGHFQFPDQKQIVCQPCITATH